jgi:hypothetical protein
MLANEAHEVSSFGRAVPCDLLLLATEIFAYNRDKTRCFLKF